MDRRFLTVLGMSVVLALVVAGLFYQVANRAGGRNQVQMHDMVVAAEPLNIGMSIKPSQVKVVQVPTDLLPKQAFTKVEEVLERPVISNILPDEPIVEGRLAPLGSGIGLAPIIPPGMRAVAVRVNEVVGVAGFVLPGMRVDVLVTGKPQNSGDNDSRTTTVLQNITVLSANQQMQSERGQAINATVVTLLVTPDQAETLTLAGNEGRIQLALRTPIDQKIEPTPGKILSELYGGQKPKPAPVQRAAAPKPPPPAPPPPPPAPVVVPDEIIMIRGNQKSVEVIGMRQQNP
ncbi:MAG: Flp pilus assembly protein CpaB [Bryobacterales bacterium]|nr:Flp pilus assembly protein CpaB [Bryobacterales bacterium]